MESLFLIINKYFFTLSNNLKKISDHCTRRRIHTCARTNKCESTKIIRFNDNCVIYAVNAIKRMSEPISTGPTLPCNIPFSSIEISATCR